MTRYTLLVSLVICALAACHPQARTDNPAVANEDAVVDSFHWNTENFSDKQILHYQVPGFEKLNLSQKKLVYYLVQAGLDGRDILWDQQYRHNLAIRKALETIIKGYRDNQDNPECQQFIYYAKNTFFSNGIHHHYAHDKFIPDFSQEHFTQLLQQTGYALAPEIIQVIFGPILDAKKINPDPKADVIATSAINFYGPGITAKEVRASYKKMSTNAGPEPISFGLNSRRLKGPNGNLHEQVCHANGLNAEAIREVIKWRKTKPGNRITHPILSTRRSESMGSIQQRLGSGNSGRHRLHQWLPPPRLHPANAGIWRTIRSPAHKSIIS